MMRFILAVLFSIPAWALSNAVTIQEKSGSTQTARVLTIPRYFANKEICLNPRPYSGGSAVSFWQADVKNRWPGDAGCAGGYAKFALITIEIPSLAGNGTMAVEFRSDSALNSGGVGLTKAAMLNLDAGGGAGSWGAKVTSTLTGLSDSVSALAMIGNDQYQVIESGPLRTSVLVREGPESIQATATRATSFGYRCTGLCTAPYATATWIHDPAYNSIRPSFVITFYTPHASTATVETDYLLDNSWMDRSQDQRFDSLVMYNGAGETNACYTAPSAFVFPARTRIFETCYSTTPAAMNIDFNRAYVTYSKATPAYSLDLPTGASAAALQVAAFNTTDRGATVGTGTDALGYGQMARGAPTGGSSPIIGWVAQWNAQYITSGFDSTLLPVVLGNAKANMHAPYWFLENGTGAYLTGNSASAFGRDVSIDSRTLFASSSANGATGSAGPTSPTGAAINSSCNAPPAGGCMVTCATGGMFWCSRYASGGSTWTMDNAHSDNEFFVAYLFTGKRVYLEGLWTVANIHIAYFYPQDPPQGINSRWGKRGIILDPSQTPRGSVWPLRNIGMAALLSDDGSVDQAYLVQKLNNNLEMHEGRHDIENGSFPPANPSCSTFNLATETSIWRMGRCYYDGGATAYGAYGANPLHFPQRHYFPLGPWGAFGGDLTLTGDGENGAWTEVYWSIILGWLRDVGYGAGALHDTANAYFTHLFADPGRTDGSPTLAFVQWQPELLPKAVGYLQTFAAIKAALINSSVLTKAVNNSTTIFELPIYNGSAGVSWNPAINVGQYWKVDNEIVRVMCCSSAALIKSLASVDSTTDTVATTTAHGYTDGQLVRVRANTTIDPGMVGNSKCKPNYPGGSKNDECVVYVHVVDATHLQFYNDSALTSKIDLQGGGSWYVVTNTLNPVVRGMLGTVAASHNAEAVISLYPVVTADFEDSDPSGGHGFYYLAAVSGAVDHDTTVIAEGNGITKPLAGQTITARRAYDILRQTVRHQNWQGANVANCGAVGLGYNSCDNSQWSIRPRPLIRNVRVVPASTSATLYYSAPDGNTCRVGVSATPFASTDDAGDTLDGQKNLARTYSALGLSTGTSYFYRITCGPLGGAGRVTGTFTTP